MNSKQQGMRIVLIGFMGAGKTTVGRELAQQLGIDFFDLDEQIVARSGFPSVRDLFNSRGESFFRSQEADVFRELLQHQRVVIATGGGIISNDLAADDLEKSAQLGETVYLEGKFQTLVDRVGGDPGRPLFHDTEKAKTLFDTRRSLYFKFAAWSCQVDVESPEKIAEIIALRVLSRSI